MDWIIIKTDFYLAGMKDSAFCFYKEKGRRDGALTRLMIRIYNHLVRYQRIGNDRSFFLS